MLNNKSKPIRDILLQYLRSEGLETPLLEYRLINAWPEIVGPVVARYTGSISIRNAILYVQIKSASLKQNLQMMKTELIRKLNNHVGSSIINDIHFT